MTRKFYAAAVDEGAGGAAEVVQEINMAAMMAKHGTKSSEGSAKPEPIEIPGAKEELKTEVIPETAKVKEEPKVEVKPEEPKTEPKKEEAKATPEPIVQEKPKEPSLDEVLKKNQPDTIFKALGFDDEKTAFVSELKDADPKLVGIMQAYKNGTLGEYVRELSTDYQKMSAEEVMRHQLRREYPKASPKALDALYESEVIEKYKLDPDSYSEAEIEKGKLLLEAKADKYRDEFTANQEKFLMPNPPEPKKEPVPDNTAELEAEQRVGAYRKELQDHPYTKDIIANKKIKLGEGEEAFNYPVDAQELIDVLSDPKKWSETMWDIQNGVPKTEHQLAVAAFALDSKKFLKEYAQHLKAIGAKEVIDPIENASSPDKSTPAKSEADITDPAKAMAKYGRKVSGGI